MKSLLEVIDEIINEGKLSKKATPLMTEIFNYFKDLNPNNCDKKTRPFYDYIVKNCEGVELSNNYKELKENSYVIFQKSKRNPDNFLTVIFTRPNKMDTSKELDSICFSGFIDNSFWDKQTFERISSLKKFFGEYKRGCPIEIYEVPNEDAYSTHVKSNIRYDLGGQLYNK